MCSCWEVRTRPTQQEADYKAVRKDEPGGEMRPQLVEPCNCYQSSDSPVDDIFTNLEKLLFQMNGLMIDG